MTPALLDTTISFDRAFELPAGLHINAAFRVLICSTHNSYYTNSSYRRHLLDLYRIKGALLKSYCQIIDAADLHVSPNDVPQPIHIPPAIEGLKVESGFGCRRCSYLSINRYVVLNHTRKCQSNIIQSGLKEVQVIQSLWFPNLKWFRVQPFTVSEPEPGSESGDIHLINLQRNSLNTAFDQAQAAYYSKYESINEPAHISEYTPWLRASNFAAHLQGLTLSELADVYALPDKDDEPALFYVI
jgi:hypothetical protein